MSRFGPSKLSTERSSSPGGKRSTSPVISPKKKAFVSTIKSVEVFGIPPPLPPVHGSPEGKWNLELIGPDISTGVVADPDSLASSHVHLLKRQSVRWLNLSLNLWSLAVLDVYRPVTPESIASFLEMVSWRAHDKVTAEEFSVLYSDWVARPEKGSSSSHSKRITVGVFGLRQLLLEKKYGEADLDLCIGIIINEINLRLLNSSVSYVNRKPGSTQNPFSLEVCTEKWLSLCDELFFTLDTPGYGILRFDEAFFFIACVTVGMQGWESEDELEADLSLATLTAATLQFLSDTGAHVSLRGGQQHDLELLWAMDPSASLRGAGGRRTSLAAQQQQPSSSYNRSSGSGNGKCEVTLAMFKRYLLKRSVGEASLAALLAHVQSCVERVARLARVSGAEDLYQACRPYEAELGSIGSPRLWQQAVLIASGHVYQPPSSETLRGARAADGSHSLGSNVPPIILFLLSDAERLLSGSLRANELPTDGTGFIASFGTISEGSSGPMESPTAANEELHECVYRIWNQFRRWGSDSTCSSGSAGNGGGGSTAPVSNNTTGSGRSLWSGGFHNPGSFYGSAASQAELADVQRDPLYQLILTAALQYKSLQQLLLAALFDVTLSQFGVGGSGAATQAGQVGPLVVVCAGLAPNPQRVLVELGYTEERSSWNNADAGNVTGMRGVGVGSPLSRAPPSQSAVMMTSIDSPVIPSPSTTTDSIAPSRAPSSTSPLPAPPARRRKPQVTGTGGPESDSDLYTLPQSATGGSGKERDRSPARLFVAETASSAAKKRASQRIQEQRAAMASAAAAAAEVSSVEDEVAQAKWSSLFSSQKMARAPAVQTGADGPSHIASGTSAKEAKLPASPSSSAQSRSRPLPRASSASTGSRSHHAEPRPATSSAALHDSSLHSLSDEEAVLLSEILRTSDVARQNALIERMKELRVGSSPDSDSRQAAPAETPLDDKRARSREDRADSGTENGAFGQFQKLEESVLFEYEKRLADNGNGSSVKEGSTAGEQGDTQDSNAAASDAASLGPSSIEELLQLGKGTGQYAQMLREILRKMSRDDSTLQLRSLEQVLALGHSLAQQDSQERLHEQRLSQGQGHRKGRSPSPKRPGGNGSHSSHNNSFSEHASDRDSPQAARQSQTPHIATRNGFHGAPAPIPAPAPALFTPGPAEVPSATPRVGANGAITRLARVPGLTPDPTAKKTKKVFGHAVK